MPDGSMLEAKPIKLLIVDDDPDYARLLVECFTGLGFQVVYVDSGHKALQEVEKLVPDIVLLDIVMPEMDGFEVC